MVVVDTSAWVEFLRGTGSPAAVRVRDALARNERLGVVDVVRMELLAAHRAGITTVIVPARNEPDLDDVPASVLAELTVHPLSDVREVLALALEPAEAQALAA